MTEEEKLFVPLPMSYNSDKLEQADLAGVLNWPSEHPDINSLISKKDLGDPSVSAPLRTERHMAEVLIVATACTATVANAFQVGP